MEKETLKEKTAKGLFWGALNNGTMQLLNIVIGILLARLLTATDYGLMGMLAVLQRLQGHCRKVDLLLRLPIWNVQRIMIIILSFGLVL